VKPSQLRALMWFSAVVGVAALVLVVLTATQSAWFQCMLAVVVALAALTRAFFYRAMIRQSETAQADPARAAQD
jgi:hypothetical protein